MLSCSTFLSRSDVGLWVSGFCQPRRLARLTIWLLIGVADDGEYCSLLAHMSEADYLFSLVLCCSPLHFLDILYEYFVIWSLLTIVLSFCLSCYMRATTLRGRHN
jgi:hypothetical protein